MLIRVLLVSCCALMLVVTLFVIKYVSGLTDVNAYAHSGKVDDIAAAWKDREAEEAKKPDKDKGTPSPTLTATPHPTPTDAPLPEVNFSEQYAHLGDYKEVYAYGSGVAYGLRYPLYGDEYCSEMVQKAAEALLAEQLDKFGRDTDKDCKLVIDYEDGTFGELLSVLFRVEREIDGVKEVEAKPWVYNKKNGEAVEAETLFADRAYAYIAERINEVAVDGNDASEESENRQIEGNRETFSAYLLTADGAKFFYEKGGGESSITIPYSELHTYMAVTIGGTVIAETIRKLDPEKPMIALTFDDGPHYKNTPWLLEILEENNARSTFFLLGSRTAWNGSPEAVEKLVKSGNEIASHTQNHKDLATLSIEDLNAEIADAREAIYSLTGDYPTFVRTPYGSYNDTVKKHVNAPLVLWNLDSEDWKSGNRDTIVSHVLEEARDGKIVLMHDIHTCTVEAVEVLIPKLKEKGYQIVTVRELLYYKGVELVNGVVYHSSYN